MTNMMLIEFRRLMAERRGFAVGSLDYQYRTRAARKLVQMMRGISVVEWAQ